MSAPLVTLNPPPESSKWLGWARALREMSQTGLTYARDPYDIARYERMRDIAAEMMAEHSDADLAYVRGLFALETGHATPKVDVRAAVFRDEKLLLVKERSDGGWTLPGGWADPGESPAEAVARETLEESGFEVRVLRLVALYDRDRHEHPPHPYHVYKAFFECEITGGTAAPSPETDDVGFFAEEMLPPLSLARVTERQLKRLFEHHREPLTPADFD